MTPRTAPPKQGAPLLLCLPGGVEAEYVDGCYQGWEGSVEIPADLKETWFWFGSFLSDGDVGIFTGTFGIPGVFEQARIHMELRRTLVVEFGGPRQLSMFGEAA